MLNNITIFPLAALFLSTSIHPVMSMDNEDLDYRGNSSIRGYEQIITNTNSSVMEIDEQQNAPMYTSDVFLKGFEEGEQWAKDMVVTMLKTNDVSSQETLIDMFYEGLKKTNVQLKQLFMDLSKGTDDFAQKIVGRTLTSGLRNNHSGALELLTTLSKSSDATQWEKARDLLCKGIIKQHQWPRQVISAFLKSTNVNEYNTTVEAIDQWFRKVNEPLNTITFEAKLKDARELYLNLQKNSDLAQQNLINFLSCNNQVDRRMARQVLVLGLQNNAPWAEKVIVSILKSNNVQQLKVVANLIISQLSSRGGWALELLKTLSKSTDVYEKNMAINVLIGKLSQNSEDESGQHILAHLLVQENDNDQETANIAITRGLQNKASWVTKSFTFFAKSRNEDIRNAGNLLLLRCLLNEIPEAQKIIINFANSDDLYESDVADSILFKTVLCPPFYNSDWAKTILVDLSKSDVRYNRILCMRKKAGGVFC